MSFDYRLRRGPFDPPPGPDAEASGVGFYAQSNDPGAVGPFSIWIDTSDPNRLQFWRRNVADDDWDGTVEIKADDGLSLTGNDGLTLTATDGGVIGSMTLTAASSITLTALGGNIQMSSPLAIDFIDDDDNTLVRFHPADGTIHYFGLPTADPVSEGQLWLDVAGGRVLKVSQG